MLKLYSIILIVISIFLTFYSLIIIPAKSQHRQLSLIKDQLKPGVRIITHSGISGIVILVLNKTLIIEQKDGLKTEVLKISVKALNE